MDINGISEAELLARAERIKPLVVQDRLFHYIKPVDIFNIAYMWSPEITEKAPAMKHLATIDTVHSYGAPVFFKPSIGEVLAYIPAHLVDRVVAFSMQEDSHGFNADNTKHVAVVDLFELPENI